METGLACIGPPAGLLRLGHSRHTFVYLSNEREMEPESFHSGDDA